MKVLVDTSVWSLALRRGVPAESRWASELMELIAEGQVQMLGAIRQELLSGIRVPAQFKKLQESLRAFPDLVLQTEDYEQGAICFNRCRAKGLQGSNTDFLICAVALRRELSILTTDEDFRGFQRILPIRLHQLRPPAGRAPPT